METWSPTPHGRTPEAVKQTETTAEKVRNGEPVRVNEFRIGSGSAGNTTDSFIELFNSGSSPVDLSDWSLTGHPAQQAIFAPV